MLNSRPVSYRFIQAGAVMVLAAAVFQGCRQPGGGVGSTHPALPPDFALRLHVTGKSDSDNLFHRTAQYVVEPDRQLRVALGAGAKIDYYPRPTRILSRAAYYDLSQHVHRHHLMAEPASIGSEADDVDVRYEVEITAHGRTHRYTTTPDESPPTLGLLRRLAGLHGPQMEQEP